MQSIGNQLRQDRFQHYDHQEFYLRGSAVMQAQGIRVRCPRFEVIRFVASPEVIRKGWLQVDDLDLSICSITGRRAGPQGPPGRRHSRRVVSMSRHSWLLGQRRIADELSRRLDLCQRLRKSCEGQATAAAASSPSAEGHRPGVRGCRRCTAAGEFRCAKLCTDIRHCAAGISFCSWSREVWLAPGL